MIPERPGDAVEGSPARTSGPCFIGFGVFGGPAPDRSSATGSDASIRRGGERIGDGSPGVSSFHENRNEDCPDGREPAPGGSFGKHPAGGVVSPAVLKPILRCPGGIADQIWHKGVCAGMIAARYPAPQRKKNDYGGNVYD